MIAFTILFLGLFVSVAVAASVGLLALLNVLFDLCAGQPALVASSVAPAAEPVSFSAPVVEEQEPAEVLRRPAEERSPAASAQPLQKLAV